MMLALSDNELSKFSGIVVYKVGVEKKLNQMRDLLNNFQEIFRGVNEH